MKRIATQLQTSIPSRALRPVQIAGAPANVAITEYWEYWWMDTPKTPHAQSAADSSIPSFRWKIRE